MKVITSLFAILFIAGSLQAQYLSSSNQSTHIFRNHLPDLVITKIGVASTSPNAGYHLIRVPVEVTIKNTGKAMATSKLGLATKIRLGSLRSLYIVIKQLPAGQSKTFRLNMTVPRSSMGKYISLASTVDYKRQVTESNEHNNYKKVRIKLPYLGKVKGRTP